MIMMKVYNINNKKKQKKRDKYVNPRTNMRPQTVFLLANLDCVIVTHCYFFRCIFLVVSSISFKPQKV